MEGHLLFGGFRLPVEEVGERQKEENHEKHQRVQHCNRHATKTDRSVVRRQRTPSCTAMQQSRNKNEPVRFPAKPKGHQECSKRKVCTVSPSDARSNRQMIRIVQFSGTKHNRFNSLMASTAVMQTSNSISADMTVPEYLTRSAAPSHHSTRP